MSYFTLQAEAQLSSFQQGALYVQKHEFKKALPLLQQAAQNGNAEAYFFLGIMNINGDGVQQDYPLALLYFKKALENGYKNAAYDVGAIYRNGEGVPKDTQRAKKYYLIAAENNYALAQFELAKIYGYEQNNQQFMFWATKALQNGYKPRTRTDEKIIAYLHSLQK
jgi:TPR repeat protein